MLGRATETLKSLLKLHILRPKNNHGQVQEFEAFCRKRTTQKRIILPQIKGPSYSKSCFTDIESICLYGSLKMCENKSKSSKEGQGKVTG